MLPELSKGLWQELGLDHETGLDRMSLGPNPDAWVVVEEQDGNRHSVRRMNPALSGQLRKLESSYDFDDFLFVSLGASDTYTYSVGGNTYSRVSQSLKSKLASLKSSGKTIMVSSVIDHSSSLARV